MLGCVLVGLWEVVGWDYKVRLVWILRCVWFVFGRDFGVCSNVNMGVDWWDFDVCFIWVLGCVLVGLWDVVGWDYEVCLFYFLRCVWCGCG